jgi:hypothetical protein
MSAEDTRGSGQDAVSFESRRRNLLRLTARPDGPPPGSTESLASGEDLYGNRAIALLCLGRHVKESNAQLRHTAAWFEHPHPHGRKHRGESDFAAQKLCLAWRLFHGTEKLEADTAASIRRFFLENEFSSFHGSENHALLFRASRCVMGSAFTDETFRAYGRKGAEVAAEDTAWLKSYIRFRARRGWGEFDSSCYFLPAWESLTTLHDHAEDGELRELARKMLNVRLADQVVDSLNGMACGAQGRIYEKQALDHVAENTRPMHYLYFGNVPGHGLRSACVETLATSFRPLPIIGCIERDRKTPYVNRERVHLHNTQDCRPKAPLSGSLRRYTWYTPQCVLGAVQYQDPYPADAGCWYAHHEQHEWDFSFTTGTTARIFTHHPGHPGPEHGYWTGDLGCRCVSTFQHENVVLALYDIPEDQPYRFIHAWVPRAAFDALREEDGWVFVRSGEAFGALHLSDGYKWTISGAYADREVISTGSRKAVVCEAGRVADYGSFEGFRSEVLATRVRFDRNAMRLEYDSSRAGRVSMDRGSLRQVNGRDVDLDYPSHDCPYLQSAWDSGVVRLIKGDREEVLDFGA